ncbi:MAG: RloB domain-containing protein, partial [Bacteroidetes bacterium]|nr:RloB domain-containing protein [Bacteroidota bacterium]
FDKTTKIFDTCLKAENQLKIHLKDYDKTQKYFTKQDNDIYLKLKPYIKTAISNSFSLGQFDLQETNKSVCEMYLLFRCEELKKYYE